MSIESFLTATIIAIILVIWLVIRLAKCIHTDEDCMLKRAIKKFIDKA
jgi:hypothetical protein